MIDEAHQRWQHARDAGESVIVCATDHVTVHALSARARAARVAAGEVEPGGTPAGGHLVGVGDEIVTLRNDRRLTTTGDGWVRNGDRWTVQARGDDGSLAVEDLNGRGRTTLPGDYVADHVTLGYAVTIHKAQGVTVDHAIVLVDERTAAEALYVGMTRGRATNTALVVCDDIDLDHPPAGPPPTPTEIIVAALGRVTAERAALDVQRDTRRHVETIPALTARLADLNAWIKQEAPPDRSRELTRAAHDLDRARQHCRPGHLTRTGREDRHILETLQARHDRLVDQQHQRDGWLVDHADTLLDRDQLAATLTASRVERSIARMTFPPEPMALGLASEPAFDAGERDLGSAARGRRDTWDAEAGERQGEATPEDAWKFAARLENNDGPVRPSRGMDDGLGIDL